MPQTPFFRPSSSFRHFTHEPALRSMDNCDWDSVLQFTSDSVDHGFYEQAEGPRKADLTPNHLQIPTPPVRVFAFSCTALFWPLTSRRFIFRLHMMAPQPAKTPMMNQICLSQFPRPSFPALKIIHDHPTWRCCRPTPSSSMSTRPFCSRPQITHFDHFYLLP